MTANVITYRGRSAAREVGKALGLPAEMQDRLAKLVANWGYQDPEETPHQAPARGRVRSARIRASASSPRCGRASRTCRVISASTRAAWSSPPDRLDDVVPLEPATMPGRVVIQWDKDDCAALGIVKVDLLGLRMMSVLQESIAMVHERGRRGRSRAPARGRPERLRDAPGGRHDRRVPGGEPRADGDAAAHPARDVLRPRRAGGDHPPGADRGRHGASLHPPPARPRARDLSRTRASSRSSSARSACRSSRSSCCAWRWSPRGSRGTRGRGAAPRVRIQAQRARMAMSRRSCARAWRARASRATPPSRSSTPSPRSRSMASPSAS